MAKRNDHPVSDRHVPEFPPDMAPSGRGSWRSRPLRCLGCVGIVPSNKAQTAIPFRIHAFGHVCWFIASRETPMLFAVRDIDPEFTGADSVVSLNNLPGSLHLSRSMSPRFHDGFLTGCTSQRRGQKLGFSDSDAVHLSFR